MTETKVNIENILGKTPTKVVIDFEKGNVSFIFEHTTLHLCKMIRYTTEAEHELIEVRGDWKTLVNFPLLEIIKLETCVKHVEKNIQYAVLTQGGSMIFEWIYRFDSRDTDDAIEMVEYFTEEPENYPLPEKDKGLFIIYNSGEVEEIVI